MACDFGRAEGASCANSARMPGRGLGTGASDPSWRCSFCTEHTTWSERCEPLDTVSWRWRTRDRLGQKLTRRPS